MDLWDLLYIQLASWSQHPGYLREGAKVPSPQELCELTNRFMEAREIYKWQQSPPQP